MKLAPVLVACSVILITCADPPDPTVEDPQTGQLDADPDVAEILCEADGSTTVLTPNVVVQPDGIHVHVVSHLDEPAEIIDLGHDVDPGETRWVSHAPPGTVETACNPFSQHGTGEVPATTPIQILDPEGLYVSGEIHCAGAVSSSIGDFAEAPMNVGPVPLDEAREALRGLDEDDQVLHAGYPEQVDAGVIVRRDLQVVASFSFVTFDGQDWVVEGSTICESSGITYGH